MLAFGSGFGLELFVSLGLGFGDSYGIRRMVSGARSEEKNSLRASAVCFSLAWLGSRCLTVPVHSPRSQLLNIGPLSVTTARHLAAHPQTLKSDTAQTSQQRKTPVIPVRSRPMGLAILQTRAPCGLTHNHVKLYGRGIHLTCQLLAPKPRHLAGNDLCPLESDTPNKPLKRQMCTLVHLKQCRWASS